jgi:hypothetical protein
MQLNASDKERLLRKLECLDDHQLDRIESLIFGMEEQRKRLAGLKRRRRPLKRGGENIILIEDAS